MRACAQLPLPLTHLRRLQSPVESEREVFLTWECLKLFGHLLTCFHEFQSGGERTTNHGKKTHTLESMNCWIIFFFLAFAKEADAGK